MTTPKYVSTKFGDTTYLLQLVSISKGKEVVDASTKVSAIAETEEQAIAMIEHYWSKRK